MSSQTAPNVTAQSSGKIGCEVCLALNPGHRHTCERCGGAIHSRVHHSIQRTVALLITAILLYIPANTLPIMITEQLGQVTPSTIMGGVITLWKMGSYPIALVIFIASVIIPIAKLISLCWLCWVAHSRRPARRVDNTVLYRVTEFVGRWSMVDVFVVAVLAALVKLTGILTIHPGMAAFAFAGVVIVTMAAAHSFDQRLIWDNKP